MQFATTIQHTGPARMIGAIAGVMITAILLVAFVVTNLGLGFEGNGHRGPLVQPAATVSQ